MEHLKPGDLHGATWRRASASFANGQCVEVAGLRTGVIAVRDSKNPGGPALRLSAPAWNGLLRHAAR
ncbi:DUF397 domain-containing protein [Actinocorallia longicatena]|uniref:DUF397 domain-containing protein n=1 Tax=Actinocorallia longicatena TaxID=111803 RepID=A0ABP6Q2X1_9ACTN